MDFSDADSLALFIGAGAQTEGFCNFGTCFVTTVRSAVVAPRGSNIPGAEMVVPFPDSNSVGSLSFVAGWSFSPRFATLLDIDVAARWKGDGFNHIVGGFVLRYSLARRLWVEAGPSFGDLEYGFNQQQMGASRRGWAHASSQSPWWPC